MTFKKWLYLSAFLFIIGIGWGLLSAGNTSGFLAEEASALDKLADILTPMPNRAIFLFILAKNLVVVVTSLIFSPLFLLVPVVVLVVNGAVLGLVSSLVLEQQSLAVLLAGLLPHGVFELPALIIAEAVAFSLGTSVMFFWTSHGRRQVLRDNLKQSSRKLQLVLLLLVVAAVVETYVTPWLIGLAR